MRGKIVLYNPRAVFWTMPLALVAIGSALDPARYEVVLVDGRLESDPVRAVLDRLDDRTICVGISVLTGCPIRDAIAVSRAVKSLMPHLPVIWGGWHPSIFPAQCLSEPSVDCVVVGQGERTFPEVVERLAGRDTLRGVSGCAYRSIEGDFQQNEARPFCDVNSLPAHEYQGMPVESYFQRKGKRQLDYISSQGCRFRCSFCADPTVYKRGWYGLSPERMAAELAELHRRYKYEEIAFQDETFFTNSNRVASIAEAFLTMGLAVDWTATMRSDQCCKLDDSLLALCRRAGLRRVMIGVESGSPETLRRIEKDITVEQILESASKCARHGFEAILNFIVGFPGESDESILQTLTLAARLRAFSPGFEAPIFYFRPYPGTSLSDSLVREGHRFPDTLEAWADFDYIGGPEPWVTREQWKTVERFKFYQRYAFGHRRHPLLRPLQSISRWRIRRGAYTFPLEKAIIERLRPPARVS